MLLVCVLCVTSYAHRKRARILNITKHREQVVMLDSHSYTNRNLCTYAEVILTIVPTTLLNFFTIKVMIKLLMYRTKGPLAMLDCRRKNNSKIRCSPFIGI